MHRSKSLFLSETAFYHAAVDSVYDHTIGENADDVVKKDDATSEAAKQEEDDDLLSNNDKMVQVAQTFLSKTCPYFLKVLEQHNDSTDSSTDRLVKIGRNITATLRYAAVMEKQEDVAERKRKTEASFQRLVTECQTLAQILDGTLGAHNDDKATTTAVVPRVRFGKTELQMPILTLGCMRFQQSWNRGDDADKHILNLDQVQRDCQDNLVNILRYAVRMGVRHIETAKGYGSSELQLGPALQTLFESGEVTREDLIIQTKGGISSSTTPAEYRDMILDQIQRLKLDYVDLFSVHGLNTDEHYDWLFQNRHDDNTVGGDDTLMDVLRTLQKEGKIRHIGFSTHGPAHVIQRFLETDAFAYVNLHYHCIGSYTASGDGPTNGTNLDNVRLAHAKDMGVFIISPYDKGGRLYAPSHRLRDVTLPELEPIEYGSLWLWHHAQHDAEKAPCHTIVCGAARASDLDQPIVAALTSQTDAAYAKCQLVDRRMQMTLEETVGRKFARTWHVGVPNSPHSVHGTQHGNIVWLYNVIKSYGLLDFAKERYVWMEGNLDKWDDAQSQKENIRKIGPGWPWTPGCAVDVTKTYDDDWTNCPPENMDQIKEAIAFVHEWCGSKKKKTEKEATADDDNGRRPPVAWETAYDMRPWTAFPERS